MLLCAEWPYLPHVLGKWVIVANKKGLLVEDA